jgi:hypothetical protein
MSVSVLNTDASVSAKTLVLAESANTFSAVNVFSANQVINATKRLYFDGGTDTYVVESAADTLSFVTNGVEKLQLASAANAFATLTTIPLKPRVGSYTNGDTTPTVSNVSYLTIANTAPTTITQLDDGVDGQLVILKFSDANSTITRANAYLAGGVNFVSTDGDTLTLIKVGATWFEVARAVSS